MGVTAYFYAFDPERAAPASLGAWRARGFVSDEGEVSALARDFIKEIPSVLGDNKRWYDNLSAAHAWALARPHLPGAERWDHLFEHLFGDQDFMQQHEPWPCASFCTLAAGVVASSQGESVYDADLVAHLLALFSCTSPVEEVLTCLEECDPEYSARIEQDWIYSAQGFACHVERWRQLLARVERMHARWHLLQHVWI